MNLLFLRIEDSGPQVKSDGDESNSTSGSTATSSPPKKSNLPALVLESTSAGKEYIRIDVYAFYEEVILGSSSGKEVDISTSKNDLFEILANKPLDEATFSTEITLKFKSLSVDHSNSRFVLLLCATKVLARDEIDAMTTNNQAITLCYVSVVPVVVVRCKLRVIEENTSPYVWYKDEGTFFSPK